MKHHFVRHNAPTPHGQKGVSLFIALISLVVMTLGALALYRSVDTVTAITGNIGLREKGVALANSATESAITWLSTADKSVLAANDASSGYYASKDYALDLTTAKNDAAKALLIFDWTKGKQVKTTDGYTLYYVVHRLCPAAGNVDATCESCGSTASSVKSITGETKGFATTGSINPCYRITGRAVGPRNVESIVQVIAK